MFFFIFAQYELSLVAHDGVNESETIVGIRVNDVNDLPPVFLQKSYNATIHEETIHTLRPILQVGGYKWLEATSPKNILEDRGPSKATKGTGKTLYSFFLFVDFCFFDILNKCFVWSFLSVSSFDKCLDSVSVWESEGKLTSWKFIGTYLAANKI